MLATPLSTADRETEVAGVTWRVTPGLTGYPDALAEMTARAEAIAVGTADELVWLLEHPPVYTAGTSADPAELIDPRFPVYPAGRGGRYTYHGPGQRIGYLMLDLGRRGRDVRRFVHAMEDWLIATLGALGISAYAVPDRIGIWTHNAQGNEAKIGAIGVRVKKWVTFHGFSINLDPDLSHFGGIVPCGISDHPVASAAQLGHRIDDATFDAALALGFPAFVQALAQSSQNEA